MKRVYSKGFLNSPFKEFIKQVITVFPLKDVTLVPITMQWPISFETGQKLHTDLKETHDILLSKFKRFSEESRK